MLLQCVKAMLYESKMSQSNIDEKNEFGDTSLHIAAKWGFREYVLLYSLHMNYCLIITAIYACAH